MHSWEIPLLLLLLLLAIEFSHSRLAVRIRKRLWFRRRRSYFTRSSSSKSNRKQRTKSTVFEIDPWESTSRSGISSFPSASVLSQSQLFPHATSWSESDQPQRLQWSIGRFGFSCSAASNPLDRWFRHWNRFQDSTPSADPGSLPTGQRAFRQADQWRNCDIESTLRIFPSQ